MLNKTANLGSKFFIVGVVIRSWSYHCRNFPVQLSNSSIYTTGEKKFLGGSRSTSVADNISLLVNPGFVSILYPQRDWKYPSNR